MTAKLIPLSSIPYSAREAEAHERARWPSRAMALDAASVEIVSAPGCHGDPWAPTIGWVLTQEAGDALAARQTHMPDGTSHCRLRARVNTEMTSIALGAYVEDIARGVDGADALAAYQAARAAE